MFTALKPILDIQELDMKMIRLMRVKKGRQEELKNLSQIREDLAHQVSLKENQILDLKKESKLLEGGIKEVLENIKKLDSRQSAIKKVEEFNALTHEMSAAEKDKHGKEQRLSDLYDKVTAEEDILKNLQLTQQETEENSQALETEICDSIRQINEEGQVLKLERDKLVSLADPEVFRVYERLLSNKKDRVVVPIENRACSGCHITLTAQDENLVRKGERMVFCEHCSRIHYWPETKVAEGVVAPTTKRRRRSTKV